MSIDKATQKKLSTIPGVGPALSAELYDLGYRDVSDLCGESPEHMYERLIALHGCHVDRCVLYVFRGAVYFAESVENSREMEPEKLKWWNWKD
ncbi:MAG: helix-hairpin-helix domain-containing protein [Desulfovibrio sp.]